MKKKISLFSGMITVIVLTAALMLFSGTAVFAVTGETNDENLAQAEFTDIPEDIMQEPLPEPEPFTGFKEIDGEWFYLVEDVIQTGYTGVIEGSLDGEDAHWYVNNGKVDLSLNDVLHITVDGDYAWWYIKNGRVSFTDTIAKNKNGWWAIKSGKVDFDHNDFALNHNGWFICKNGKVDFNVNDIIKGTVFDGTGWYLVRGGKIAEIDTVAKNKNGWWVIKSGKVDFDYNGFAQNSNGWWYIENGKVTFKTTDIIKGAAYDYESWWYVKDSKVTLTNIVAKNKNGWWAVEGGRVTFTFNGFMKNQYGYWYAEDSKITFKKTAIMQATIEGRKGQYYIKDSKVIKGYCLCVVEGKEYCIIDGVVDSSYTGYLQNKDEGTWWYIKNGVKSKSLATKITSKLFVIVDCDEQHVYLVENGKTVYSTPCVTGNVKHHNMTKRGLFSIYSKETNRDLKGRDYISHVNYWMPFDGNRGLHDAKWKKTFGGTEYLLHGSHGCVNMPMDAGEYVYNHVKVGTKVLVFGGKQSL